MILAQISDMHITRPGERLSGFVDTAAYLDKAVAQIGRLKPRPDALIITGDLVDGGRTEEYAHLRQLLAPLAMPMYVIPGNHDDRERLRVALPTTPICRARDFCTMSSTICPSPSSRWIR